MYKKRNFCKRKDLSLLFLSFLYQEVEKEREREGERVAKIRQLPNHKLHTYSTKDGLINETFKQTKQLYLGTYLVDTGRTFF